MNNNIFINLPNDIIITIIKINRMNHENKIYKKRHDLLIKHLEEYCELYEENITPKIIYNTNIKCDLLFLESNDAWENSFGECIIKKHGGGESIDYHCEIYF